MERGRVEAGDARRHQGAGRRPTSSTVTSTVRSVTSAMRSRYGRDAVAGLAPGPADGRSPLDGEVQLDGDRAVLLRDPHAPVTVERALGEAGHAHDLTSGVRGVGAEELRRDDRVALHQHPVYAPAAPRAGARYAVRADRRRTSSVTSGRANRRNGTNVVPVPGEMCMTPPGEA